MDAEVWLAKIELRLDYLTCQALKVASMRLQMLWRPRPWSRDQFLDFQRAEIELYVCEREKKYLEATKEQLTKYSMLPIKAGTYPEFDPTVPNPEEAMYK